MHYPSKMDIARWSRLMDAWGFLSNQETFASLLAAYSEKDRHYHTAQHVAACLRHLDCSAIKLEQPREVELALWFHDAIYNPLSSNNEQDSADWAASFMAESGATAQETARVHRLIMATQHNAPTATHDEAVLIDIDLSILGVDSASYDTFEQQVRMEYRWVPWFIYRKKRAEILRGFIARPKIYTSGVFSEAIEHQAKANLAHAVAKLEQGA